MKLIVNLPDSDHRWNSTFIRVSSPWEASVESGMGTSRGLGVRTQLPVVASWSQRSPRSGPRSCTKSNTISVTGVSF